MDLFPNDRLPLIPEAILRAHKVHQACDTRFRACARLLQALYREKADFPIGSYTAANGKRRKIGSRLGPFPASCGLNFLDAQVINLARRELAYREPGAAIDEERLWGNLLSSMPLAFNLFGPLKLRPRLAEKFIAAIVPEYAGAKVAQIAFEHSPARGDESFTADASAFDAFIALRLEDGRKAFLAFEVKYAEAMTEPEPRHRPRYDELAIASRLFIDPDDAALRKNPIQQLWREHMLAHSLVSNGLYDEGKFILLAPALNRDVQRGAAAYARHLAGNPADVPFLNITLDAAAEALKVSGEGAYARQFVERYLDFAPVHALI